MKKTLTTGWECLEKDNEWSCVINDPMLSQYRVYHYITTGKHTMKTPDKQIPSNLSKNMVAQYNSIHSDNPTKRKLFSKHEEIKWDRKNPCLFLRDWRRNDAKMEIEMCDTECLGQIQLREKWGRQWIVIKIRGKNWKSFKNCLRNAKHTFFATEVSRQ